MKYLQSKSVVMNNRPFTVVMPCSVAIAIVGMSTAVDAKEWIRVHVQTDAVDYVNLDYHRQDGDSVYIKSLVDFKEKMPSVDGPVGSIIAVDRYNCSKRSYDIIEITSYSGQMAKGKRYGVSEPNVMNIQIVKNTPAESKYNYACSK